MGADAGVGSCIDAECCRRCCWKGSRIARFLIVAFVVLSLLSASLVSLVLTFDRDGPYEPERRASALAGVAPYFVFPSLPVNPTNGEWGLPVSFTAYVKDNDSDPINVTWEWGDGTYSYNNTPASSSAQKIVQIHTYAPDKPPGQDYIDFLLNITLDDGNGNTALRVINVHIVIDPPNHPPEILSLDVAGSTSLKVDPSDNVTISASARDVEGEPLTWMFVFNDSESDYRTAVVHTDATAPNELVWVNLTHVFGSVGRHYITLNVSDARIPYQIFPHNISLTKVIDVVLNSAPGSSTRISVDPATPIIKFPEMTSITVNYSVEAFDPDGDILYVIWDFCDGSPLVVNTSAGGTVSVQYFVQSRTYTAAGWQNVTVNITDGRVGHEIILNATVLIDSTNLPPDIIKFRALNLSGGIFAEAGEPLEFELIIYDQESDPIEVTIDWGDGSPLLYLNLTEFVSGNATVYLNHTYVEKGNYTIIVYFTDNMIGLFDHYRNYSLQIEVRIVYEEIVEGWSWWDYTSLVLLCIVPVLIALRFYMVVQKRKRIEAEGLTMEEWKLLKEERESGGGSVG